jgi:hypothetical protein
MKYTLIFFILSSFTLYLTSCEKAEPAQVYESEHAKHERLGIRADDCSGCDPADCCCQVIGVSAGTINLTFCGTTNPDISTNVCGPIALDGCPDINGFSWFEALGQGDDEFFCVQKGTSFMVGSSMASQFTISCQYGQTSPQIINISLSAGEKKYYTADNACFLTECELE